MPIPWGRVIDTLGEIAAEASVSVVPLVLARVKGFIDGVPLPRTCA